MFIEPSASTDNRQANLPLLLLFNRSSPVVWFLQDPLFRFFEREVKMGGKMLQEIRQDLTDVVQVCEGKKKQTNDLRTLINDLVKGKPIVTMTPHVIQR